MFFFEKGWVMVGARGALKGFIGGLKRFPGFLMSFGYRFHMVSLWRQVVFWDI